MEKNDWGEKKQNDSIKKRVGINKKKKNENK
jgi:hypothetical protein